MHTSILVEKIVKSESLGGNESLFVSSCKFYTFLNPVSYLNAIKNTSLFSCFDGIFADGTLMVKAIRLFYGKKVSRRSFDMTSLAQEVFTYANANKKRVCVVASEQNALNSALDSFTFVFPGIEWVGCRNGYFSSVEEMENYAKLIVGLNPDYLIVGMGAGLQERFLLMCKKSGYSGIGFTCGGFIHQTADIPDGLNYYPKWVDKTNTRFIYRMFKEPHTIKRYAVALFVFPIVFIRERILG